MIPMPLPRLLAAIPLMSLLVAACAAPDPTPSVEASRAATVAPSPSTDPTASPEPTASPDPTPEPPTGEPPPLALEVVAEGLAEPIGLATGPDGWLLVQEQHGRVISVETASGETSVTLDISDRVLGGGERGLLGLALHPDFPDDARAFVHYTDGRGNTVLSEFDVTDVDDPIGIDPTTEDVLLQVEQPFSNHNGG